MCLTSNHVTRTASLWMVMAFVLTSSSSSCCSLAHRLPLLQLPLPVSRSHARSSRSLLLPIQRRGRLIKSAKRSSDLISKASRQQQHPGEQVRLGAGARDISCSREDLQAASERRRSARWERESHAAAAACVRRRHTLVRCTSLTRLKESCSPN